MQTRRARFFPRSRRAFWCWLALLCALGPSALARQESPTLVVHAASSLRAVCEDVEELYAGLRPDVQLRFNFGASSDLAGQIMVGAPGDLFLSADVRQIARLGDLPFLDLCSNRLVVVEPALESSRLGSGLNSVEDLHRMRWISIAEPGGVPAGVYARAWLESIDQWESLKSRLAPAINARAALAAVESGACEAGILYATDASHSERVRVAFVVPEVEQPAIRYGIVILEETQFRAEAERLQSLLISATGTALLSSAGFLPSVAEPSYEPLPEAVAPSPWGPLWISLQVAGCATLLVFLPGAWLGWCLARKRFFGRSLVETIVALPLVLPPTAIGYLLLRSFAADGLFGGSLDLLLTWKGAVAAASIMSLPLVARTARIAFEQVDPRLESMGASLGWSNWEVLRRVTWPLASRGLFAGAILGFSRALGEFGATVIVAGNIPGETQTLALAIFQDIQLGREERAMQLLGLSVLLAFGAVWSVEFLIRKDWSRKGGEV